MDEEEDLDLKLVLDNYHANLDGCVIAFGCLPSHFEGD